MPINQPPARRTNQPGTGFTNIQRVLQANLANRLGGAVAGGVQQAGQQARGAITGAGEQFKTEFQKEQERLAQEKERSQRVLGDVTGATEEDVRAFQGILGGKTLGPQGIKNIGELGQQAREAGQLGRAAGTEAGRYGLLQRYIGGGQQYTGGQQRLDALLLGQTAAPQLREARRGTLGLETQLQRQQAAAGAAGQELASRARGLADVTRGGLEEQVVGYGQTMQQKAQEAAAARQSYIEQARKNLEEGKVDQATLEALGLDVGTRLYGTDLSNLLVQSPVLATAQTVQTPEEFARIRALQQLSGQALTGEASAILPQFTDESQVGAFEAAGPYADINKELVKQAIAGQERLYRGTVDPLQQRIQDITTATGTAPLGLANLADPAKAQIRDFTALGYSPEFIDTLRTQPITESPQAYQQLENLAQQLGIAGMSSDQLIQGYGGAFGQFLGGVREKLAKEQAIKQAQEKFKFNRTLQMLS